MMKKKKMIHQVKQRIVSDENSVSNNLIKQRSQQQQPDCNKMKPPSKVSSSGAREEPITSLDQANNLAIVGLIRQLSALSNQSEQLFDDLYSQCAQFHQRTNLLAKRVTGLRNIVNELDAKKVKPKPSLGELMGDLFLLTTSSTSSSNDILKWTTTEEIITTSERDDEDNNDVDGEEAEDHEELVRRIVTNAKVDDAITEKRLLCRKAALDTWLRDFKSFQPFHPGDIVDDDRRGHITSNNKNHIIDYDSNSIYDNLKQYHPTLNLFNYKNRPKTIKSLYSQAQRDTQAHFNKLIRQHIALIRSSKYSSTTNGSTSPSSVSTIVRSSYSQPDYHYRQSQLPVRSKSARFLRPRFTLPMDDSSTVVVGQDKCNRKNVLSDPDESTSSNKKLMVKSISSCLGNKSTTTTTTTTNGSYCSSSHLTKQDNRNASLQLSILQPLAVETDSSNNQQCDTNSVLMEQQQQQQQQQRQQKEEPLNSDASSGTNTHDSALSRQVMDETSLDHVDKTSIDNDDADADDNRRQVTDHQHGTLDLNHKTTLDHKTTMETDLDDQQQQQQQQQQQHQLRHEEDQQVNKQRDAADARHYSSSSGSNLDDSMRANNPSECSRSITIATIDDSAASKSTVANYRSDSSIGPYSSTCTGISSIRPGTLTTNSDFNHSGTVNSDNICYDAKESASTTNKQLGGGFKSFTLLRNIVKRASFRRSFNSTSATATANSTVKLASSNLTKNQSIHLSSNDNTSKVLPEMSDDCCKSMASLLPSPEEKLIQLSDQFKPKFVPIDVDSMFKRSNSSRRSLLHADFKIKRSRSQASDHSCNNKNRNSCRRQSRREKHKNNFDDAGCSSHRNRDSQVTWQTLNRLKSSKSEHRVNEVSVQTEFTDCNLDNNRDGLDDADCPNSIEKKSCSNPERNRPVSIANCNLISTTTREPFSSKAADDDKQFNTNPSTHVDNILIVQDAGHSSSGNWSESSPTTSETDRIRRQQRIDNINQENNRTVIKNNKKPISIATTTSSSNKTPLPCNGDDGIMTKNQHLSIKQSMMIESDLDKPANVKFGSRVDACSIKKEEAESKTARMLLDDNDIRHKNIVLNSELRRMRTNAKYHHMSDKDEQQQQTRHQIFKQISPSQLNSNTKRAHRSGISSSSQIPSANRIQNYSTRVSQSSKQSIHIIPLVPAPPTDDEEASSVYSCDTDGFYTSMHTDCGLYRLCNEGIDEEEQEGEIYKSMFNEMIDSQKQQTQRFAQSQSTANSYNIDVANSNNRMVVVSKKTSPQRFQHGSTGSPSEALLSKVGEEKNHQIYSSSSTLEEDKCSPLSNKIAKAAPIRTGSKPPPPSPPQRKDSLTSDTREVLLQIYMQMRNLSHLNSDQINTNTDDSNKILKEAMDEEHRVNRARYNGNNQSSAPSSIYDNHIDQEQRLSSAYNDTNNSHNQINNHPALRSSSQCSSSCLAPSTILDSPSPSGGVASSSMRSVLNDLKLSMEALTSLPSDSNESLLMQRNKHNQQQTNTIIMSTDELDDYNQQQTFKRHSKSILPDKQQSIVWSKKDHELKDESAIVKHQQLATTKIDDDTKEDNIKAAYKDIEKRKNTLKAMLKSLTSRTVSFRSKTPKQKSPPPSSKDDLHLKKANDNKFQEDSIDFSQKTQDKTKENIKLDTKPVKKEEKPSSQLEITVDAADLIESQTSQETSNKKNDIIDKSEKLSDEKISQIASEMEDEEKEKYDDVDESLIDEARLNECRMRMLFPISRYQPPLSNQTPVSNKKTMDYQELKRQSNASQYENEISNPDNDEKDNGYSSVDINSSEIDPIDVFNSWQANRSGHGRDPASVRTRLSSGSLADIGLSRNRNSWSGESSSSPCSSSPTTAPSSSPLSPQINVDCIMEHSNGILSSSSTTISQKLQQANLNAPTPEIDNYIDDDASEDNDLKDENKQQINQKENQKIASNVGDNFGIKSKSLEDHHAPSLYLASGIVNLAFNDHFMDDEEEDEERINQEHTVSLNANDNNSLQQVPFGNEKENVNLTHQLKTKQSINDYDVLPLKHCQSSSPVILTSKKGNGRKLLNGINSTSMFAPSCEPISEEDSQEESSDNNKNDAEKMSL